MKTSRVLAWLLLLGVVAGCAGPVHLAQLPTDEQRCVSAAGVYRAGLCDYCR